MSLILRCETLTFIQGNHRYTLTMNVLKKTIIILVSCQKFQFEKLENKSKQNVNLKLYYIGTEFLYEKNQMGNKFVSVFVSTVNKKQKVKAHKSNVSVSIAKVMKKLNGNILFDKIQFNLSRKNIRVLLK